MAPPNPWLAISALVVIPVSVFCSIPIWKSYLNEKLYSSPTQPYAADPGQLGGFALVALVFFTGFVAALIGLVLTFISHKKRERLVGVRILAWLVNGFVALIGVLAILDRIL